MAEVLVEGLPTSPAQGQRDLSATEEMILDETLWNEGG